MFRKLLIPSLLNELWDGNVLKSMNKKANVNYSEKNRIGGHIWYISNVNKFRSHYPEWDYKYDIYKIMDEIASNQR